MRFVFGLYLIVSFIAPVRQNKVKCEKDKAAITDDGNVLVVHDQGGAERNVVFRSGFFVLL